MRLQSFLRTIPLFAATLTLCVSAALGDVHQLAVGDAMPQTAFFDERGRSFTFADFRGQTVVLSFIYTRCADALECPLVSAHFRQLQTKLGAGPYHLVEVTLDPAFDTPEVLARYGKRFGADPNRWSFGTGPTDVVLGFAAQLGIVPFPDQRGGLIHSERTALIDRNGRIADLLDEPAWNPDNVVAKVRSLNNLPSNPIARLDYELSKMSAALCGNQQPGYSGLLSLAVMALTFIGACWILYRVARKIFLEEA